VRAVLLRDVGTVEVVDVAEPAPADDEVVIAVKATGICGSDLHAYRGHHPFRKPPVVLGHEVAGEVVAVGPRAGTARPGDRVAVEPQISCGSCDACLDGLTNFCRRMRRPGQPGAGWSGTFAERMVAPERVLYRLADEITYAEGSMVEPLAVAYRAFRRAGVAMGMRVAVLGVGNIGALIAHLCQRARVSTLLVTDVKDYNLDFVAALGDCAPVNAARADVVAEGMRLTGGEGFDVVAVASGARDALLEAARLCRPQGVIALVSLFPEHVPLDGTAMVLREVQVRSSLTYTAADFRESTRLVNTRGVDLRPFITRRVGLEEAPAAFREMDAGLDYVKVMIDLEAPEGA
jgi:2-desacetyl-2-hydroxyethyl bacteriochlorophyllide A dehydrogenase